MSAGCIMPVKHFCFQSLIEIKVITLTFRQTGTERLRGNRCSKKVCKSNKTNPTVEVSVLSALQMQRDVKATSATMQSFFKITSLRNNFLSSALQCDLTVEYRE